MRRLDEITAALLQTAWRKKKEAFDGRAVHAPSPECRAQVCTAEAVERLPAAEGKSPLRRRNALAVEADSRREAIEPLRSILGNVRKGE